MTDIAFIFDENFYYSLVVFVGLGISSFLFGYFTSLLISLFNKISH